MNTKQDRVPRAVMVRIRRQAETDWDDDPDGVQNEIDTEANAYLELRNIEGDDIPDCVLTELKHVTEQEHPNDHSSQLECVESGIEHYHYVQRFSDIKGLLVKMEHIIGNECYNANIQNYEPGGVWEGEGRSFRYPISCIVDGRNDKFSTIPCDISPEALMTGRYKFCANELNIFRALEKKL